MMTSVYARNYTGGARTPFSYVWQEAVEMLEEIPKGNWKAVLEEFGDTVHHFQLWLYTLGWDTRLWMWCARKFIARQVVWQELYSFCGLTFRACYGGNYNRLEKVIRHLVKMGVTETQAREAHAAIVLKK